MAGSKGGGHRSHGRGSGGRPLPTIDGSGAGGGGGDPDPCAALALVTMLQSPRPDVVRGLSAGDRLDVRQDDTSAAIIAVTNDGRVAGAVVPSDVDALADCLATGRAFVADVLRVRGGSVEVRVRAG